MFKIDDLALMTGSVIQLDDPVVKVHQPTLEDIALIGGEKKLFQSLNMFYIDSEPLVQYIDSLEDIEEEDREQMKEEITPYDSLLFVLRIYSEPQHKRDFDSLIKLIQNVFHLMMPTYEFVFDTENKSMLLNDNEGSHSIVVDREFFMIMKNIATEVFLLDTFFKTDAESDMSEAAKKIAEKMAKAEEKLNKDKEEESSSQFALIVSILGLQHPIDYLRSLTIYQIYDQFERFNLFNQYDQSMKAALAGASDVEMVNWYKKI